MTEDTKQTSAPTRKIGKLGAPEDTAKRRRRLSELQQVLLLLNEDELDTVLKAARNVLQGTP